MLKWTEANDREAKTEGWYLQSTGAGKRLHRWEPATFTDLVAVRLYVLRRAKRGSPLHLKVLAILYAENRSEFYDIVEHLPPNTGGDLIKIIMTMARVAGSIQGDDT